MLPNFTVVICGAILTVLMLAVTGSGLVAPETHTRVGAMPEVGRPMMQRMITEPAGQAQIAAFGLARRGEELIRLRALVPTADVAPSTQQDDASAAEPAAEAVGAAALGDEAEAPATPVTVPTNPYAVLRAATRSPAATAPEPAAAPVEIAALPPGDAPAGAAPAEAVPDAPASVVETPGAHPMEGPAAAVETSVASTSVNVDPAVAPPATRSVPVAEVAPAGPQAAAAPSTAAAEMQAAAPSGPSAQAAVALSTPPIAVGEPAVPAEPVSAEPVAPATPAASAAPATPVKPDDPMEPAAPVATAPARPDAVAPVALAEPLPAVRQAGASASSPLGSAVRMNFRLPGSHAPTLRIPSPHATALHASGSVKARGKSEAAKATVASAAKKPIRHVVHPVQHRPVRRAAAAPAASFDPFGTYSATAGSSYK